MDVMFFKTKHNTIILYQQLSSWDKTYCMGWLGMDPLENLNGMIYNILKTYKQASKLACHNIVFFNLHVSV